MIYKFSALFAGACFLGACAAPIVEKVVPIEAASTSNPKNYRLSPNDQVTITVFQEADMTTSQQIARDGSISFPLIGRVIIGGLTLDEAERLITKRLSANFLVNPQVAISVTQYAPQSYTILGQVGGPGAYPIPYEEEAFTLPMAIARAGGNTRIGNLRNIRINRRQGDKLSQFTVNMLSSEGQQFLIERGDLITVQETLF